MEEAGGVGDPLEMAMEEAGGVGDPLISDGNLEVSTVSTTFWWPFTADNVYVNIWNDVQKQWEYTQLGMNDETQQHWVQLRLRPSIYWFFFCVDGIIQHNPYFSWETMESGEKVNYISVKEPEPGKHYESCEGYPVSFKHFKSSSSVFISGSWDGGKQRHKMQQSKNDYVKLLWLDPGQYHMRFYVDGVPCVDQGTAYVQDADGNGWSNIVNVNSEPQSHELHGNTAAALLHDFMARPEHEVSIIVKFNAGSRCGNIPLEAKACPCTETGYMLLSGFVGSFKDTYMRGGSWAGCFKPSDMVVVDGKHCQMRKRATKKLTRVNFLLDVLQLKDCLFLKYKKEGSLPPYFTSMFSFLEDPPEDFDSNKASRDHFLDFFDNQAALATPPRRMLPLINMGQFFKQLPEHLKPKFALSFISILNYAYAWQTTTENDTFLWKVFVAKRKLKPDGKTLVNPVANTSLEATYSLRIFFIHGPEHSIVNGVQILTDFAEFDLIIAHYFERLLADLLQCVHDNVDEHVLIKALWNFYCGGAPPDHLQLELWTPPAAPSAAPA